MAAGLGTRLRPFTDLEPKAILPLMGIPMAQYAMDALCAAGAARIVANIHHLPERALGGLQGLERGGAELIVSDERDRLLGSGGGLRKALPHFGSEPFFLVNADVLCDVDLAALARRHQRLRAQWGVTLTLTVFRSGPPGEKYREIEFDAASGLMTRLGDFATGRPYFVGAAVLEPEALARAPAEGAFEFVPEILIPAVAERKVGVFCSEGLWHDMGSPLLWRNAHLALIQALESGPVPELWRRRIERANERVANLCWISKGSPRGIRTSRWAGPCYWNSLGDETAAAPGEFGPDAVLYGPVPQLRSGQALRGGIGLRGIWV